jgi:hypothetical protein
MCITFYGKPDVALALFLRIPDGTLVSWNTVVDTLAGRRPATTGGGGALEEDIALVHICTTVRKERKGREREGRVLRHGALRRWLGEERWHRDLQALVLLRECESPACASLQPRPSPAAARDPGARVFHHELGAAQGLELGENLRHGRGELGASAAGRRGLGRHRSRARRRRWGTSQARHRWMKITEL